jgi:hypothetical protein
MPQLARLAVKHGVDDNLASLNLILEEHARAIVATEERSALVSVPESTAA